MTVRGAAAVVLLVLAGLMLRLHGAGWGAPHGYHYDEPFVLKPALRMVADGDPNPRFFRYPSGLIYAVTGVVALEHRMGGMDLTIPQGPAYGPADLGPWTWPALLDGRRLVAVLGAVAIAAVAMLAFRTGGPTAAIVAAALLTFLPLHVEHSHYLTTDVPAATFLAMSLAVAARRPARTPRLLLAGLWLGLAVATKYTAAAAAPGVAIVSMLSAQGGRARAALVTLVSCAATFAAVCPYALLDWQAFIADLAIVRAHYGGGHLGAEGSGNWLWYLARLRDDGLGTVGLGILAAGFVALVASATSGGRLGSRPGRDDPSRHGLAVALLVLVVAASWWLALGSVTVRFERNLIPAMVLACAAAGHGLALVIDAARGMDRRAGVAASAVLALAMLWPVSMSAQVARDLAGADTRSLAAAWIDANIPAGSRIVREEYTPRPDPSRFRVEHVWSLGSREPSWYRQAGVQYLIASRAVHGRYRRNGSDGAAAVAGRYNRIFLFPKVASFAPGPDARGPAIAIYGVASRNDPRPAAP